MLSFGVFEFMSLGHARAIADSSLFTLHFKDSSLFTLHSSLFVLRSYEESLTRKPLI